MVMAFYNVSKDKVLARSQMEQSINYPLESSSLNRNMTFQLAQMALEGKHGPKDFKLAKSALMMSAFMGNKKAEEQLMAPPFID